LLLPLARRAHPGVPVGVVGPGLAGRLPAAADPAYGAVDVAHLEHLLEPGAAEVDVGLEAGGAERAALVGQHPQGVAHLVLPGEGEGGEVGPDVAVLGLGQEDDGRAVRAAPGTAD